MKSALIRCIVPAFVLIGLPVPAAAQIEVPQVPTNLTVPEGHTLFLATRATGTQNYICLPTGRRMWGWRFIGPQATLFVDNGGGVAQQVTTHFLSVNPAEGTTARPTWQHSMDTSRVWGRVRESSIDPNYVAPGAIPWLLLERAGVQAGPTGGSLMTQTTFIHRVNTSGGVAPSSGCSNDDHIGTVALVPYTTDYFFYRAMQQ